MRDGSQHLEQLIVQFQEDRRDGCSDRDIAGNEALYLQLHHDTFVQGYIVPCHPVLTPPPKSCSKVVLNLGNVPICKESCCELPERAKFEGCHLSAQSVAADHPVFKGCCMDVERLNPVI
jgi:hypothetical protein